MDKKHIHEKMKATRNELDSIQKKIFNNIVNEEEAQNLFTELEVCVKKLLVNIFGIDKINKNSEDEEDDENVIINEITDSDRYGLIGKEFYSLLSDNQFKDAVLFNYKSHKVKKAALISSINEPGYFRSNLYYKGSRWSDCLLFKNFYMFFNDIKKIHDSVVPVDFFTKHSSNNDISSLILKTNSDSNAVLFDKRKNILFLPDLNNNKVPLSIKSLVKFIQNCKIHYSSHPDVATKYYKSFSSSFGEEYRKLFDTAYIDFKRSKLFEKWNNEFQRCCNKSKISPMDVFRLVISYQFYDIPFNIYLFFPKLKRGNKYLVSSLVITGQNSLRFSEDHILLFEKIIDLIKVLALYEEEVWKKLGEFIPLYYNWKDKYEKQVERYERLRNTAVSICSAVCRDKKVKIHAIPSRIKDFNSFYNKIVNRANGRQKDLENSKKDFYFQSIKNINEDNVINIFNELKDIVGIRIICIFNKDVNKIVDYLLNIKSRDLKRVDHKEFSKKDFGLSKEFVNYRSHHVTFKLGLNRLKILEFNDLEKLKFEIQVRSILAQGWADVSHDLFYKTGLPEQVEDEFFEESKESMNMEAINLVKIDEGFDKLKRNHNRFIKKINNN